MARAWKSVSGIFAAIPHQDYSIEAGELKNLAVVALAVIDALYQRRPRVVFTGRISAVIFSIPKEIREISGL